MKPKLIFMAIILPLLLGMGLVAAKETSAADIRKAEKEDSSIIIKKEEVIKDDLYVFGNSVDVQGSVQGDLFVFGTNVKVSGPVAGNIIAAGQFIDISSDVKGDVFIGGNYVTLGGKIAGNTFIGGNLVIAKGNVVKDLFVGGSDVNIDATIGDDLRVGAARLSVKGSVGGDFMSGSKPYVNEIKVTGKSYIGEESEIETVKVAQTRDILTELLRSVFYTVGILLLLVVAYKFMPVKIGKIVAQSNKGYVKWIFAFGIGVVFTFFVPVVAFVVLLIGLLMPNVLLPLYGTLVVLFGVLWTFVLFFAAVITGFVIGGKIQRKLLGNEKSTWVAKALTGAAFFGILALLKLVPFVDVVASTIGFLLFLTSVGFIVLEKGEKLFLTKK